MATPCPCGTQKQAGKETVQYITQTLLNAVSGPLLIPIESLIWPAYGRAFSLNDLCARLPPQPHPVLVDWYVDPLAHLDEIVDNVLWIEWAQFCECTPCPPIAGCAGAYSIPLGPSDGYCHDTEVIGGVETCVQQQYVLYGGVDVYVSRDSDGHCFGPFNGLVVDWIINSTFDPALNVTLESYGGGGHTGWNGALLGQNMTAYLGAGSGGSPVWEWDQGGVTVAATPVGPACDPTTICTAVDYIREQVQTMRVLVSQLDYAVRGTSAGGDFPLPGTINNANGTLIDILRQAVTALAPMTPTQLTGSTTTPVAVSTAFSVVGKQFVEIAFTALDPSFGARGTTAPVFYSAARYPGPGWVLVCSDYGVMEYHELKYPQNTQIQLPPLATHLLIELNALVEVNVTTFERDVSL